jgi:hypothetical protein
MKVKFIINDGGKKALTTLYDFGFNKLGKTPILKAKLKPDTKFLFVDMEAKTIVESPDDYSTYSEVVGSPYIGKMDFKYTPSHYRGGRNKPLSTDDDGQSDIEKQIEALEEEFKFSSSGTAKSVFDLIAAYRSLKEKA